MNVSPSPLKSIDSNLSTVDVAIQLLGKELVVQTSRGPLGGIITETEAYTQDDPACHAYMGKRTPRNAPMFEEAGQIYAYFIYGMYFCVNIVTEEKGVGAAVLIRGIQPTQGVDIMKAHRQWKKNHIKGLTDGPGKLAQALGVSKDWNAYRVGESPISVMDRGITPMSIQRLPRVGISRAKDRLWRFVAESPSFLNLTK